MRRALRTLAVLVPAALLAASAQAVERPSYDAYFDVSLAAGAPAAPPVASSRLGAAASIDPRRGVPSFLWAAPASSPPASASPEAAARGYLVERAALWGVPPAALGGAELVRVHDVGRGSVLAVFRQRRDGVEVFRGELKVLMRKSLELVAIAGSPRGLLAGETKQGGASFTIAAGDAVARAFEDLYEVPLSPASLVEGKARGGYRVLDLGPAPEIAHTGIRFVAPARVKKVFFALPDRLVPAYFLEIQAGKRTETVADAYAYVVGAADGRVLYRRSLTQADSFDYRVWADAEKRPLDGPQADYSPHPTGTPDGSSPAFVAPVLVSMEGFNTNPNAVADPWLPAGALESLGNNVDAYSDHDAPDGYSAGDLRATTTGPSIFDRVFDTDAAPLATQDQTRAAVTQLFYTTNWLHDWFYDSGFDEAAGNAQADNFGRGGLGGDVMHAEAQDGALTGSRNNANMSTPADGESPRMQMFLWDAVSSHSLTVQPLALTPPSGTAPFGPQSFDVTAPLALANDGAGTPTDACEPLVGAAAGSIVLVDRGTCTFVQKAQRAEAAGAVGVIIANNVANAGPAPLAGSGAVGIPVLSISLEDGSALKAALQNGAQTATMSSAAGVERDGTIDNTVIAHEWGHYLHHRLVECGLRQCNGESEGWGDFIALTMLVRPGDDLDGTFAIAGYASAASGDSGYFGLRRFPYSVDFSKNALTFKHIANGEMLPNVPSAQNGNDNAEAHNAGEIWATMLFEGFVALLKKSTGPLPPYSFDEARRRMSDYVVTGLALAPIEPTFTQQRDAILAAAYAADPLDMLVLADAFAVRGAGSCAVSPPQDSTDLTGVVESYSTGSSFTVLSAAIDDAVFSCDGDGVLDAEEMGEVTVEVMNTGLSPLTGASVTVTTPTPGVSFPDGANAILAPVEPFAVGVAKIRVALDASVTSVGFLDLTATVNEPTACVPTQAVVRVPRINFDNVPAASATDDVESDLVAWTPTGDLAAKVWSREETSPQNHAFRAVDYPSISDTQLQSPPLDVSAVDPFVVTFQHRYQFEADATTTWDGAVIEISTDGGTNWQDVDSLVAPGYTGVVSNQADNPLSDRAAYVGESAAWPALEPVTLDFGAAFAGQTILLRFRAGSDQAASAFGWEIDDIAFQGITNTPFAIVVDDATDCNHAPLADAGPDQTVTSGDAVALDATASSDADGDPLAFSWTQIAGPSVTLAGAGTAGPTFTAPDVAATTVLTFEVAASDAMSSDTDSVDVVVEPPGGATSSSGTGAGGGAAGGTGGAGGGVPLGDNDGNAADAGGGCGCEVPASRGRGGVAALVIAGLLLRRRRRSRRAP